jgi:hypothetical protein
MDDRLGPPLLDRHRQRVEHALRPQIGAHRPADDSATEDVQHHGQVQESRPGRDVGDISDPELVRGRGGKDPLHEVGRGRGGRIPPRRPDALAPAHAHQPLGAHQPRDALAAHADPVLPQILMNPRYPVGAVRARVELTDLGHHDSIRLRPLRGLPVPPPVVPARRDPQDATLRRDRVHGLVIPHEPVDPDGIVSVSRAN